MALDHATSGDNKSRTWPTGDFARKQRAADLAEWHAVLIQRLADTDDLLDKLANHPTLAGPELDFVRARLAHQRGDVEAARALMTNAPDQASRARRDAGLRHRHRRAASRTCPRNRRKPRLNAKAPRNQTSTVRAILHSTRAHAQAKCYVAWLTRMRNPY
jgi:hypothetical protein